MASSRAQRFTATQVRALVEADSEDDGSDSDIETEVITLFEK